MAYKARGNKTRLCLKCGVIEAEHRKRCYINLIWFLDKPNFYQFHSEGESARYAELLRLVELGAISNLRIQVSFKLSKGVYIADFTYWDRRLVSFWHPNGRFVVEDYKGNYEGEIFKRKWKEMQKLYPENYYKISDKPNGVKL